MNVKLRLSLIALCVFAISQNLQAQIVDSPQKVGKQKTIKIKPAASTISTNSDGKNLVKINLLAFPLRNFSFQYERAIGSKISAVMGVKFMPTGKLPMINTIKNLIDDPETNEQLDNLKIGNTSFTPEFRIYFGEDVFKGFYLAPFARFSTFTTNLPINYDYKDTKTGNTYTQTIPLNGKINALTGGLMIGAQWKLSKLLYLDWWILGPHYGTSTGSIKVTQALTADEQEGLRNELENLADEDSPLKGTTTVDANGARVDFKSPFIGIRAGLCLGFRF